MKKNRHIKNVLAVGTSSVDILALDARMTSPRRIITSAGGGCRNIGCWLRSAGCGVRLYSVIGEDPWGNWLEMQTAHFGVECRFQRAKQARTPLFTARVLNSGEIANEIFDDGGCFQKFDDGMDEGIHKNFDDSIALLVVSTDVSCRLFWTLQALAKRSNTRLALSIVSPDKPRDEIRKWLECSDFVFLNTFELAYVLGSSRQRAPEGILRELEQLGSRSRTMIICTGGSLGASWYDAESETSGFLAAPSVSFEIASALGCGDALAAGFLAHILDGASPRDALGIGLRMANEALRWFGSLPAASKMMPSGT